MLQQLPVECLNDIFEYLEDDKITLYSCMLVNRLYCKIAVEILWRNVLDISIGFKYSYKLHASLSIFNTLIAFLPKESKDFLHKNGIYFITSTQKLPLFNYPSFCSFISYCRIERMIRTLKEKATNLWGLNHDDSERLLSKEIFKMLMNQSLSLKSLEYSLGNFDNIEFISSSEVKNLAELRCRSDSHPKFFNQISQICYNLQSLTVNFVTLISEGLNLIFSQNNLKRLTLISTYIIIPYFNDDFEGRKKAIIPFLTKCSLTLTELNLIEFYVPLSFVAMFTNLQELSFSFKYNSFDEFDQLQYVHFSQLKILTFLFSSPKIEMLVKFLEINGKNLTEFHVEEDHNNSLNLAISKFCPNLKILSAVFEDDELETLKLILNNCQYLEIIRLRYGNGWSNGKMFFKILAKYSQNNFYELSIDCSENGLLNIFHEELEEFFTNWKDRIPQKSISLIIIRGYKNTNNENMKMTIGKYIKMGIIKKFVPDGRSEY
jgi:hypothetical protein